MHLVGHTVRTHSLLQIIVVPDDHWLLTCQRETGWTDSAGRTIQGTMQHKAQCSAWHGAGQGSVQSTTAHISMLTQQWKLPKFSAAETLNSRWKLRLKDNNIYFHSSEVHTMGICPVHSAVQRRNGRQ